MGSRNGNYKHGRYSADAVASRRFRPERNRLTGLRLTVLSLAVPRSEGAGASGERNSSESIGEPKLA